MSRTRFFKYIIAEQIGKSESGKTLIFGISSLGQNMQIGIIKWIASWRTYGYFPNAETFYEKQCLRDIADFLVELEKEKKSKSGAKCKVVHYLEKGKRLGNFYSCSKSISTEGYYSRIWNNVTCKDCLKNAEVKQ